jgi:hypothetical protein
MSGEKRMRTQVGPDGRIDVSVPEWPPGQPVEVTVRPLDEPKTRRSAKEILAEAPGGRLFKTVEEVDAYIRGERDSWER